MSQFIPMNSMMLESSLALFSKVSAIVTGFLSLVIAMRLCYLVVTVSHGSDYAEVLKDLVVYLALISLFPILIKALLSGVGSIALKIPVNIDESVHEGIQGFISKLFSDLPFLSVSGELGHLIIFGSIQSIYSILMALFIAAAPIFIFLSTALKISVGVSSYFSVVMALSMWPVMYNLIAALGAQIGTHFSDSPISSFCFWIVIQFLQLLSPFFSFAFFKNMSGDTGISKVLILKRMMS